MLQDISDWKGMAILSFKPGCDENLCNLINYNLPPNNWRAVINSNGIFQSVNCMKESTTGKIIYKYVSSNAVNTSSLLLENTNIVPLDQPEGTCIIP